MQKVHDMLFEFYDSSLNPHAKYGEIHTSIVFGKRLDEKYVDSGVPYGKCRWYFSSQEKLDEFDKTYDATKYQA